MQTEKVQTVDKNEEAHLRTEKRTNQTSTDSEAAIQVTDLLTSSIHYVRKPVKEHNNNSYVGEKGIELKRYVRSSQGFCF